MASLERNLDKGLGKTAKAAPLIVSAILIVLCSAYYANMIGGLDFSHSDEFLTLDRTYGFISHDDPWTVYSENRPSFKKPPLQYWISMELMRNNFDVQTALRLPSLVFGIALIVVTGLFARFLLPSNPWVAPAAVLLLVSQTTFWQSANAALLDAGNVLFSTTALLAAFLALRAPKWWLAVGIACLLGSLQKAPAPAILVALALSSLAATRSFGKDDLVTPFGTRYFWIGFGLALAGLFAWPLVQLVQHGRATLGDFFFVELVDKFAPVNVITEKTNLDVVMQDLLFAIDPVLRTAGTLSLFWIPWKLGRRELIVLPILFTVYIAAEAFRPGDVSVRYFVYFVPLISASLAAVIASLEISRFVRVLLVVILSATSLGPFKDQSVLAIDENIAIPQYMPFLQRFADEVGTSDILVLCKMPGRNEIEGPRIRRAAFSFYASKGKTFQIVTPNKMADFIAETQETSSLYRGLCTATQFEDFRSRLKDVKIIDAKDAYIHWTATGLDNVI